MTLWPYHFIKSRKKLDREIFARPQWPLISSKSCFRWDLSVAQTKNENFRHKNAQSLSLARKSTKKATAYKIRYLYYKFTRCISDWDVRFLISEMSKISRPLQNNGIQKSPLPHSLRPKMLKTQNSRWFQIYQKSNFNDSLISKKSEIFIVYQIFKKSRNQNNKKISNSKKSHDYHFQKISQC